MKTAPVPRGLAVVLFVALAAGCGTIDLSPGSPRQTVTDQSTREQAGLSSALAHYSIAMMEREAGDTEASIARYEEAVRNDPDNPDLQIELAIALLHAGRFEDMDALLDGLIREHPRTTRAYQLKALGLRVRGLNAEALDPLAQAIKLEPSEPINYIESASIQLRLGNQDDALDTLESGLESSTNRLAIFHALGEVYLKEASDLATLKDARLPSAPLEMLELAAQEFPKDPYLLNQFGDLLVLHGRMEDAIEVFARIEELQPADLQLRQKLAVSLVALGDRKRAIEMLEDIADKRRNNHRLWYYLGELHEQDGNMARAVECYEEVIALRPREPEGYLRMSYLQLGLKRYDDARATLEKGAKANPDDLRLVEMQAYVLMTDADYTGALALFEQVEKTLVARNAQPLLTNFYLNYAISAQQSGDLEGAARALRTGLEANPGVIDEFLALALRDRQNESRLASTLSVLDLIKDIMPDDSSTLIVHALVAFNADQYEVAMPLFERAETQAEAEGNEDALDAQFYFWMGACAERLKDYEKAEAYFLDAINAQPDHADSHNYVAYMNAERGVKLDAALDHADVALAVEPDNAAYLDTRGWIYFKMGQYEKALTDIAAAAELMPDDPTITDHLGDVHLALGNTDEAAKWWRTSLELDPDNQAVADKLKDLASPPTPPPTTPN